MVETHGTAILIIASVVGGLDLQAKYWVLLFVQLKIQSKNANGNYLHMPTCHTHAIIQLLIFR